MPEIPTNPDSPGLPPENAPEALDASAPGDFLGLEEDLGITAPKPPDPIGDGAMLAPEQVAAATWTEEDPAEYPPDGPPNEPYGEEYGGDPAHAQEEPWSEDSELGEAEEDSASWLMELDGEDEFLLQGESQQGFVPGDPQGEDHAPAAGKAWALRLLFAAVSIAIGFAGARYLGEIRTPNTSPGDPVAVRNPVPGPTTPASPETAPGGPAPAVEVALESEPPVVEEPAPVQPEVTAETAGELLPEIATTTPEAATTTPAESNPGTDPGTFVARSARERTGSNRTPFLSLTGAGSRPRLTPVSPFIRASRTPFAPLPTEPPPTPLITVAEGPTPAVPGENGQDPADGGREHRTQIVQVEDMVLLPEELSGNLREASAAELAGMWMGASIPLDAIESGTRLLTPAVGRVRVLLGGGEVFEGELYAVGQKKVWLETALGKMALLSWQIDRIEHILTRDGTAALGEDGSQDLVGLERVRVRTPGGVFYGKVIDNAGDTVTLITDDGARITLQEATVGPAGRSATRLVDASGAQEEVQEKAPEGE